jgi:hypothetical protein
MAPTAQPVSHSARALVSFMSEQEAQAFSLQTLDPPTFLAAWRARSGNAGQLTASAPPPRVEELTPRGESHAGSIRAHPMFVATYGSAAEIKMIELEKLIACQFSVDTHVSESFHGASLPPTPDEDQILEACLPSQIVAPARAHWHVVEGQSVTVTTSDLTFDLAAGFPLANPSNGQVGLILSPGANLMFVKRFGSFFVLQNGYHRAWTLRGRGVAMVPVVVASVSDPSALTLGPGFFQPSVLTQNRPPLVGDFSDDALATTTEVRAMMKVVKMTIERLHIPMII